MPGLFPSVSARGVPCQPYPQGGNRGPLVQLALFGQGKVDGAGMVRRGRGQSPFSAPTGVVGTIFFCQQFFKLQSFVSDITDCT